MVLNGNAFSSTAAASTGNCGLSNPALCETFDGPAGTGNRSGQLDGALWGVSHVSGDQNYVNPANGWGSSVQTVCGASQQVQPPTDVFVCNGQLVEGMDDNQEVQALTMYPKQPFDFAGRTGKVTFDVSNDTQGSHAAWPEFWITDKPGPAPFAHFATLQSLPQNGFGIRFAGFVDSSGTANPCPEGSPAYVGVDSAITIANYVENDTDNGGNLTIHGFDCVKTSTSPTQLNHYEIDVSQNQIDVFGTDAGTTAPLKHIATILNPHLNFTRGLIWLEDVHYNGDKFNTQGTHAFTWDNVGFDGPVLPRDLAYDVNDSLTSSGQTDPNNGKPVINLGWYLTANATKTFTLNNVASPSSGTGALLTLGFWYEATPPFNINYTINGHAHTLPWPYPDNLAYTPRTIAIPLNLGDLQPGTNTIAITPPVNMNIFNVDLILQGAAGVGSTAPTATATATATHVATSTPTRTPTPQPTATKVPPTNTPTRAPTSTPTSLIPPLPTLPLPHAAAPGESKTGAPAHTP